MDLFGWIVLIALLVGIVVPLIFRRKREQQPSTRQERKPFFLFMFDRIDSNPSVSMDEVVEAYVTRYGLAVPRHPDEPAILTMNRAKLQVLEEFVVQHPNYNKEANFERYLTGLRLWVPTMDEVMPDLLKNPDILKQMKERGIPGEEFRGRL
jgi:hypothetical protein